MQAAFYEEADRAYRDIIAYDENAPITRKEIMDLYRLDACFSPVKRAANCFLEAIENIKIHTPKEYAEQCIYEGKILPGAPKGVMFAEAHLLPFTPDQAKAYDAFREAGDEVALQKLFKPLIEHALNCKGHYTPENGFTAYIAMQDHSSVIPVAEGVLYLKDDIVKLAFSVKQTGGTMPPVRDARGVLVMEILSD